MYEIKDNLICIPEGIVQELVKLGKIQLSSFRENNRAMGILEKTNRYYKVCNRNNLVFFLVQDGYGVFIDENVISMNKGITLNLIEILDKFYWYIDITNETVNRVDQEKKELSRYIGNIITYGSIEINLSSDYHVHHEGLRWDNLQRNLEILRKDEHKDRKSHRAGYRINTVEGFEKILTYIK